MQNGADQLARAAGGQGAAAGVVCVSVSQPMAHALLPPILARMRLALPDVAIDLVVSNEVSNLLRREADIAIRMVQPDQSTLIARRVGKVSLSACAHRDYLRRRGTPKTVQDLLQHEVIADGADGDIINGFAQWGATRPFEAFAFHSKDLSAYWEMVCQGMGIGFVADYRIRADPDIVPILPSLNLPSIPVWLVVHREIRTSKRIRAVFDYLAQAVPGAL
jgi:DNA-binding transcriptional LysR family regulator